MDLIPEQRPADDRVSLPDWMKAARKRGLLSRLPDQLVAAVIKGGQRAAYPPGAIVPERERGTWAAVVLGGCMRLYLPAPDGGQITLRYLRPGETIGNIVPNESTLGRSMQALEPLELLHLDATRLAALAQSEPQLAWEMLLESSRVLRMTQRFYGIRTFGSSRLRTANAILERARALERAGVGALVPGTQHELANAAGSVREVVAGALQGLKRDGIIEIRRCGVVILDPDRLAREADGGFGFGPPA